MFLIKKIPIIIILLLSFTSSWFFQGNLEVFAQENASQSEESEIVEGVVKEVYTAKCTDENGNPTEQDCSYLKVLLLDGKEVDIPVINNQNQSQNSYTWKERDRLILGKITNNEGETSYYIRDPDRQLNTVVLGIILIVVAFAVARFKGIMALGALILSTLVIFQLLIPRILAGDNTIFIGIISTILILAINQLIGHGFNKLSILNLFSSILTLLFAWFIGYLSVLMLKISGSAGEGVVFIRADKGDSFDFTGLFLAGAMIGVTGALDDVVAAQSSAIEELVSTNRHIKFKELFSRGMRIGKEHIVSMINTLFLAYAGASLPLLVIFYMNLDQSVLQLLSREDLSEEIVRTFLGCIALLIVVPLSTFISAIYFKRPDSTRDPNAAITIKNTNLRKKTSKF